jgi:membrane-bound metal-dependent hydrolase YbcI (DUF457 family)
VNLPLLFLVSILPDVDLALGFIMHRGPSHSLIVITVLSLPFFIVYRKQMVPYYLVLLSHVLVGDFITGGAQMLWPISGNSYGFLYFNVKSEIDAVIEVVLFIISLAFLVKLKDLKSFLLPETSNIALIVPFGATLGPLLQTVRAFSLGLEFELPLLLVVPSLFFVVLFAIAIIIELRYLLRSGK